MIIDFYKHNLTDEDKQECMKVLNSLFLTTGDVVKEFEKKFSQYLSLPYTVGITSCTQALMLALLQVGIGKGDEVITTPMSFIATANAIEYCNAKPIFVDVEEDTGNIDASHIERAITSKTKAILVVHLYGQMADMKAIRKIANKHNLKIVEDSAHCIEGKRDGVKPGELGDVACFSFYATKNITSGEGGAISCHSQEAYEWFMKARMHGMSKGAAERYTKKYEHYDMEFLGYKCNMTNIQAALLLHQIERLDQSLARKEEIAHLYDEGFKGNKNIAFPKVLANVKHARHLYSIWVAKDKRDEYMHRLQDKGIGIAVNFRPIHLMKYYRDKYGFKKGYLSNAEKIGDSTITLPFYPKLSEEEIQYIISTINTIIS